MKRLVLLLLASCATLRGPAESPHAASTISEYDLIPFPGGELHVRLASDGYSVAEWITNDYAIPVAVDIERDIANLHDTGATLATTVVPSHGPRRVGVWEIVDRDQHWNERTNIRTQYGDPAATPTPYLYALPFSVTESHRLIQGFNSGFSHTGDSAFAVDFEMPEGTFVRAARDGTVVAYNAKATEHGLTEEYRFTDHANWVAVLHTDGTLGQYWHLQPDGVRVKIGQHVARGDVLGISGWTGFSSIPHLHFDVQTSVNGHHAVSFPFVFKSSPDDHTGAPPIEGQTYTAFE
jgi:murein DD-endopeptidase MepM/ murein hydrolase activator NlpD